MQGSPLALVRDYIAAHHMPLRVWMAPEAWARLAEPAK